MILEVRHGRPSSETSETTSHSGRGAHRRVSWTHKYSLLRSHYYPENEITEGGKHHGQIPAEIFLRRGSVDRPVGGWNEEKRDPDSVWQIPSIPFFLSRGSHTIRGRVRVATWLHFSGRQCQIQSTEKLNTGKIWLNNYVKKGIRGCFSRVSNYLYTYQ